MKIGPFTTQLKYSLLGVLVLTSVSSSRALAQSNHAHTLTSPRHEPSADQNNRAGAFVKLVRESTAPFQDVSVAVAEGYVLQFGCVSGSDAGDGGPLRQRSPRGR